MSGYLRRAISATRKPGGSIHPLLGSVFSPMPAPKIADGARGEYGADGPTADEETAHRLAQSPDTESQLAADTPSGAALSIGRTSVLSADVANAVGARRLFSTRAGAELGESPGESGAGSVHEPPAPDGARTSSGGAFGSDAPDHANVRASVLHATAMTGESDGGSRRELSTRDRGESESDVAHVEPLIPMDRPRADAAQAIESTPALMSAAARRDAISDAVRSAVSRSTASLREAGDIQIHIGRIEVMAVAPVSPRPPPTPRQTSPSLSDYLNRRGGRPG
jgi:hypothetical protein